MKALWIPSAGYGERMRPYSYIRAKGMLPIREDGTTIVEQLIMQASLELDLDKIIVTCYYRPTDFEKLRRYPKVEIFQEEVQHGTACSYDILRLYYPDVDVWYLALGDIIVKDLKIWRRLEDYDNALVFTPLGQRSPSSCGVMYYQNYAQQFREKSAVVPEGFANANRWIGMAKWTPKTFNFEEDSPFLCTKSERNNIHGKSFASIFLERWSGNYVFFNPIMAGESIIHISNGGDYESYNGRTRQDQLERVYRDIIRSHGNGSRIESGATL